MGGGSWGGRYRESLREASGALGSSGLETPPEPPEELYGLEGGEISIRLKLRGRGLVMASWATLRSGGFPKLLGGSWALITTVISLLITLLGPYDKRILLLG